MLMAMFFSAVCKSTDLDEDDIEEDELNPELDPHQDWVYKNKGLSYIKLVLTYN